MRVTEENQFCGHTCPLAFVSESWVGMTWKNEQTVGSCVQLAAGLWGHRVKMTSAGTPWDLGNRGVECKQARYCLLENRDQRSKRGLRGGGCIFFYKGGTCDLDSPQDGLTYMDTTWIAGSKNVCDPWGLCNPSSNSFIHPLIHSLIQNLYWALWLEAPFLGFQ